MIKVTNTKEGDVWVLFENTNVLDETHGNEIVAALKGYFKQHESITIDLQGIEKIDGKGYNRLSETNRLAFENNCEILFTNVDDNISEIIDSFTLTSES